MQEGFNVEIGDGVFINNNCFIDTSAAVNIGNNVQIAYCVTFVTGNHLMGPTGNRAGDHDPKSIAVGDGAWLGARCTIMPGVTVGAGAVVAAGAVVTRDVAPDTLVGGVPAKFLRDLEVL